MSTASIDTGIVFARRVDRVDEDHYLSFAGDHAVDLADPVDPCSCGEECWAVVAATIHQANYNQASRSVRALRDS